MSDVVTIGESMVLFQPFHGETLRYAPLFTRTIAGAESNLAIGLTRLGKTVRWIGRIGDDPFGDLIVSTLAGEGVDVSLVMRDAEAPSAVIFKEYKGKGSDPSVYYYRKDSAASRIAPSDMSEEWFAGAKHLHVTGITAALSSSAFDTVLQSMQKARQMGLTVSYDPNLRRKLWSEEEARHKLKALIPYCDYFLPGIDEAEFLLGAGEADRLGPALLAMGPQLVVIKLGTQGAAAYTAFETVKSEGVHVPQVIDTVGAGDAFAAGMLSVLLDHRELLKTGQHLPEKTALLHKMLRTANILGALAVQYRGDWEGLPTRAELDRLLAGTSEVTR